MFSLLCHSFCCIAVDRPVHLALWGFMIWMSPSILLVGIMILFGRLCIRFFLSSSSPSSLRPKESRIAMWGKYSRRRLLLILNNNLVQIVVALVEILNCLCLPFQPSTENLSVNVPRSRSGDGVLPRTISRSKRRRNGFVSFLCEVRGGSLLKYFF